MGHSAPLLSCPYLDWTWRSGLIMDLDSTRSRLCSSCNSMFMGCFGPQQLRGVTPYSYKGNLEFQRGVSVMSWGNGRSVGELLNIVYEWVA